MMIMSIEDEMYEAPLIRNKYSLKHWWAYIEARRHSKRRVRNTLHERALRCLPGSYKLWRSYLQDRVKQCRSKPITHKRYEKLNRCYERALVTLHKMPRIWSDFCEHLIAQRKVTRTRRTFDRALKALPITQHGRIWKLYVKWACDERNGIFDTAVRVWTRYLKLEPGERELYVDFLIKHKKHNLAARQLALICEDDKFVSKKAGVTRHTLWLSLCELLSKHPDPNVVGLDVDAIIRSGIQTFSDEVGRLWCALADRYIRLAMFEKARDIYEEALESVNTVRDFSLVFQAYSSYSESMLRAKMELLGDDDDDDDDDDEDDDVDLRIARLSNLMDRRPLLLNAVKLRQNPHSVEEWKQRVELVKKISGDDDEEEDPVKVIECYTNALKTIDPLKAVGKPHELWVEFAKYYESHNSLDNADAIFERATSTQSFKFLDNMASLWCEWAEMHIRHGDAHKAHALMERAVREPPGRRKIRTHEDEDEEGKQQQFTTKSSSNRLYKSKRVWSLYLDLEENLGTLVTTRAAYDRVMELRVATVRHVLNYADLLIENKFFEDSFKVYEKGVELFTWPHVQEIWLQYLVNFVKRYEGRKLERARDLFEEAIRTCPEDRSKVFYLLYAQLEEKHGLIRRAMAVYDRATENVADESKFDIFEIYLAKVEEFYGVTRTRPIFEKAVEILSDENVKTICLRFAEVERKLGEIDRARAIFIHGSQLCNPQTVLSYWKTWHDFEVQHGNEDTFREMLRIKRSVQARFSQANVMTGSMMMGESGGGGISGFVRGGVQKRKADDDDDTKSAPPKKKREIEPPSSVSSSNKRDDDDTVEEISVPDAVFGGLNASSSGGGSALERFGKA